MSKPLDGGRLSGFFESNTKTTTPSDCQQLPAWHVLLHDDAEHEMLYVVQAIMALTRYDVRESAVKMLEAHKSGLSCLLTTHQERAELYVEQFACYNLSVSIEPAD